MVEVRDGVPSNLASDCQPTDGTVIYANEMEAYIT